MKQLLIALAALLLAVERRQKKYFVSYCWYSQDYLRHGFGNVCIEGVIEEPKDIENIANAITKSEDSKKWKVAHLVILNIIKIPV